MEITGTHTPPTPHPPNLMVISPDNRGAARLLSLLFPAPVSGPPVAVDTAGILPSPMSGNDDSVTTVTY